MGPQSVQNLHSTLTTVAFLQSNLNLGVLGSDEFYGLGGCEMVGWFSVKSGCLCFPVVSCKYLCLM